MIPRVSGSIWIVLNTIKPKPLSSSEIVSHLYHLGRCAEPLRLGPALNAALEARALVPLGPLALGAARADTVAAVHARAVEMLRGLGVLLQETRRKLDII